MAAETPAPRRPLRRPRLTIAERQALARFLLQPLEAEGRAPHPDDARPRSTPEEQHGATNTAYPAHIVQRARRR